MSGSTQATEKAKMLVIEDFVPILGLYKVAFGSDFDVTAAKNFQEIEGLSGDEDFKYIITDYNLPGIVFKNLILHLRTTYPCAKIILISGTDRIDQLSREYGDDLDTVLAKPVDILSLRAKLQQGMDG